MIALPPQGRAQPIHTWFRVCAIVLSLLFGPTVQAGLDPVSESPESNRPIGTLYVLTIGVSEFSDPSLPSLPGSLADSQAILAWAESQEKLLAGSVITRHLSSKGDGSQNAATEANVFGAIVELRRKLRPHDQLILHISSHGLLNSRGGLSIATQNTQLDNLAATSVDADSLLQELMGPVLGGSSPPPPHNILVLLDLCNSGAVQTPISAQLLSAMVEKPQLTSPGADSAQPYEWLLLAASLPNQSALEDRRLECQGDKKAQGALTCAVMNALHLPADPPLGKPPTAGADTNIDGLVSYAELVQFTRMEVARQQTLLHGEVKQQVVVKGVYDEHNFAALPSYFNGRDEACNGADEDLDGKLDEGFRDSDGDGTADCMEAEECNGLDDDGDGRVDEDYDQDGDGAIAGSGCYEITPRNLLDCDDSSPHIRPGLVDDDEPRETHRLVDNDCDGQIDEDSDCTLLGSQCSIAKTTASRTSRLALWGVATAALARCAVQPIPTEPDTPGLDWDPSDQVTGSWRFVACATGAATAGVWAGYSTWKLTDFVRGVVLPGRRASD